MKVLQYKKGYLVRVVSWENDGDNYATKEYQPETIKEALWQKKIFETLFKSHHNSEYGISNDGSCDDYTDDKLAVYDMFPTDIVSREEFCDYISDMSGELLGYSDFYDYRVCESFEVFEIEEDIYFKEIK